MIAIEMAETAEKPMTSGINRARIGQLDEDIIANGAGRCDQHEGRAQRRKSLGPRATPEHQRRDAVESDIVNPVDAILEQLPRAVGQRNRIDFAAAKMAMPTGMARMMRL